MILIILIVSLFGISGLTFMFYARMHAAFDYKLDDFYNLDPTVKDIVIKQTFREFGSAERVALTVFYVMMLPLIVFYNCFQCVKRMVQLIWISRTRQ